MTHCVKDNSYSTKYHHDVVGFAIVAMSLMVTVIDSPVPIPYTGLGCACVLYMYIGEFLRIRNQTKWKSVLTGSLQHELVWSDRGGDALGRTLHPPPPLSAVLALGPPGTLVLHCAPATQRKCLIANTHLTRTQLRACLQGM